MLLNKRELKKLAKDVEAKGLTIIPLKLFINEKGLAKLEIALANGKNYTINGKPLRIVIQSEIWTESKKSISKLVHFLYSF